MQKVFLLLWLLVINGVAVEATTYSCRDQQGRLFLTDNLQALPAECLGRQRVVEPQDPDNLHYVPAQAAQPGSGVEFRQTVRAAQRAAQQKKEQAAKMLLRAEQLEEQYQQTVQEKNNAIRRWSYGSREIVQTATARIEKIKVEKQQLLTQLEEQKISRQVAQQIGARLDEISDK